MLPHSKGKPIKEPKDLCVKHWAFETLNQFNWICWISGTVGGRLFLIQRKSALHNQTYTLIDERNIFWKCSFSSLHFYSFWFKHLHCLSPAFVPMQGTTLQVTQCIGSIIKQTICNDANHSNMKMWHFTTGLSVFLF